MFMNHQAHQAHQENIIREPDKILDDIGREIVDSAFTVHKEIGPGLLESAYEVFLLEELMDRGFNVKNQVPIEVKYKSRTVDIAYRIDILVNDCVLIELKAQEKILPIHAAQTLTYLNFAKIRLGYLINFNNRLIKDGIKRLAL